MKFLILCWTWRSVGVQESRTLVFVMNHINPAPTSHQVSLGSYSSCLFSQILWLKTWACDLWKLSILDASDLFSFCKTPFNFSHSLEIKNEYIVCRYCLSVRCAMVSTCEWMNFLFIFFFIGNFHWQMWRNFYFHAYSPLVKFTLLVGMWAVFNVCNKELVQNGEI